VEKLRDNESREYRNVKRIAMEFGFYIFLLVIFLAVSYVAVRPATSQTLAQSHSEFWNMSSMSRMSSGGEFWNWTREVLASKALSAQSSDHPVNITTVSSPIVDSFSSNDFSVSTAAQVVPGSDMILLGQIRLRQLRVSPGGCDSSKQYSQVSSFCRSDYTSSKSDSGTYFKTSFPLYLKSAYSYNSALATSGILSRASGLSYPSAGFVVNLAPDFDQAVQMLWDLERSDWIDAQTAMIVAEINTYHPLSDSYVIDRFLFEFTSIGAITISPETIVIRAGLATFEPDPSLLVLDLFILGSLCVFFVYLVSSIRAQGKRFWTWGFSYLDIFLGVLLVAYLVCRSVMYAVMAASVLGSDENLFPSPYLFWSFSALIGVYNALIVVQTLVVAVLLIRAFKLFLLSKVLAPFLGGSYGHLIGVLILVAVLVMAFSFGHSVTAGYMYFEYRSIAESIMTTSASVLNAVRIEPHWISDWSINSVLSVLFVCGMYLVLVPMIIAVGADFAWTRTPVEQTEDPNPLLVFLKLYVRTLIRTSDDFLKTNQKKKIEVKRRVGIDIGRLPGVIRKRVVKRRQDLQKRIEHELGVVNESFNEFSDFVTKQELEWLMESDAFLCRVLKTSDVDTVINRYSADPEDIINSIDPDMDENIQTTATELTEMIQSTRAKIHMDLVELKDRVARTMKLYSQSKQKSKESRSIDSGR
jgi:hypothetical protein